jgi:uncharacterized protein
MTGCERLTAARGPIPSDGLGLGLRPALYAELERYQGELGFLEVISENFLEPGGLPQANLRTFRERYPVVAHGVSLNLLGTSPLDFEYLSQVRSFLTAFNIPYATDHLCWTAHRGIQHHDLLPTPLSSGLVDYAVSRARLVQEFLGVPFGLENLSSYVSFAASDLSEWDFVRRIVLGADCFLMLDINNIYVSSQNHGFSAEEYLEAMPWDRVLQVHIAGHRVTPSGLLHDTHDRPISPEVWELYRRAWKIGGPFPTLLEWDAEIPSLQDLLGVLENAKQVRES